MGRMSTVYIIEGPTDFKSQEIAEHILAARLLRIYAHVAYWSLFTLYIPCSTYSRPKTLQDHREHEFSPRCWPAVHSVRYVVLMHSACVNLERTTMDTLTIHVKHSTGVP